MCRVGMKLELAPVVRYLLMEQRPTTVNVWAQRTKRHRFHHFTHVPRLLHHRRQK
jgi:hypothetical protein